MAQETCNAFTQNFLLQELTPRGVRACQNSIVALANLSRRAPFNNQRTLHRILRDASDMTRAYVRVNFGCVLVAPDRIFELYSKPMLTHSPPRQMQRGFYTMLLVIW